MNQKRNEYLEDSFLILLDNYFSPMPNKQIMEQALKNLLKESRKTVGKSARMRLGMFILYCNEIQRITYREISEGCGFSIQSCRMFQEKFCLSLRLQIGKFYKCKPLSQKDAETGAS